VNAEKMMEVGNKNDKKKLNGKERQRQRDTTSIVLRVTRLTCWQRCDVSTPNDRRRRGGGRQESERGRKKIME